MRRLDLLGHKTSGLTAMLVRATVSLEGWTSATSA